MKIAILGDLHIGVKNSNDSMMFHQRRFFEFFFDYLEKNGITTVFQLGDMFDQRRQINLKALRFAQDVIFDKISEKNLDFHTLVGNHDIYYRETLDIDSGGLLLKPYKNIHVHKSPETVELYGKTFDFIPWICESNRDECLTYIKNSKSNYCFGHFEINGFLMMGIEMTTGLSQNLFANYESVFSGHFHNKSRKNNILYTGTPYELNWGDAMDKKGFYVLDVDTGETEFIETPYKAYFYVRYDEVNHYYTDVQKLDLENTFVKVIVKSKIEPFRYEMFLKAIGDKKPFEVRIIDENVMELTEDSESGNINISDITELIKSYIRSQEGIDDDSKEKLCAFMMGLYTESIQQKTKGE